MGLLLKLHDESKADEICAALEAKKVKVYFKSDIKAPAYNNAIDDACRIVREKLGK